MAQRDVAPILIEGLKRLEYRGYDSAGIAVLGPAAELRRIRVKGKVRELEAALAHEAHDGGTGIAHTRWATHGEPSTRNAHPHVADDAVALVHNGIIENHAALRRDLEAQGARFSSETDTEVVVQAVAAQLRTGHPLLAAVRAALPLLQGAWALAIVARCDPTRMVVARKGSPLVIGLGIGEHFVASDVFALLPVTQRFVFLEDGDVAEITRQGYIIHDAEGRIVERPVQVSHLAPDAVEKSGYRHFMQKEIYTQARAVADTLDGRIAQGRALDEAFGLGAGSVFDGVRAVQIVACGTSFHAALVARYWLEAVARIPTSVEVASEFRYRRPMVAEDALFVSISQSGETYDTLEALREARRWGFRQTLAICNKPESSLTRDSDLVFMTRAGPEISVASTKAFTTQLVALLLLALCLGRRRGLPAEEEARLVGVLEGLPGRVNAALELGPRIEQLAEDFVHRHHALYLGRGAMYPVAMEGALKLKEISYIHAEAYPAGELKHGPLALVDEDMPVVAVAPNNDLLGKLQSNLAEVSARGGRLHVFADAALPMEETRSLGLLRVPTVDDLIAPIVYTIPLQLLAYHVAVLKGADVDQPRNLAKSVTVE